MKKTLKVILFLTLCFISVFSTKAVKLSSNFVKCATFNPFRPPLGSVLMELGVVVKDDTISAALYEQPCPFVSKLSVKEGVFEGIDIGEWGGVVRFSPFNVNQYAARISRGCPFCHSTTGNCRYSSKLPTEKKCF